MVAKEEIKVSYMPSEKMIADPMTKGLSLEKFNGHVKMMGLKFT